MTIVIIIYRSLPQHDVNRAKPKERKAPCQLFRLSIKHPLLNTDNCQRTADTCNNISSLCMYILFPDTCNILYHKMRGP